MGSSNRSQLCNIVEIIMVFTVFLASRTVTTPPRWASSSSIGNTSSPYSIIERGKALQKKLKGTSSAKRVLNKQRSIPVMKYSYTQHS